MRIFSGLACAAICVRPLMAQSNQVVLPLTLNQVPKGEVLVRIANDDVELRAADLAAAGLGGVIWDRLITLSRISGPRPAIGGGESVSLKSLAPWIRYEFDEANLTLSLVADARMFTATALNLQSGRPANVEYTSDTTTFFNYALSSRGLSDPSFFGEVGSSLKGNLLYGSVSKSPDGGWSRGLTNITRDDRKHLRRWVFGDASAITDPLGGSALVGGVTVSKNFALDPYFVRFPSMSVQGTALTPSRVDIYVNGFLVGQQELPPGPYQLTNIPVSAGSGIMRVVVRDAFGGERVETNPFYYSVGVLARGINEYLYSAGAVREGYGQSSFDYGDLAVLAYHRTGVTDRFTIGGRVEASRSLWSLGPTAATRTRFGDFDLTIAASSSHGKRGTAAQAGYRYLAPAFSFGVTARGFSREYANVSLPVESDRALHDLSGFVSVLLPRATLSAQVNASKMRDFGETRRAAVLGTVPVSQRTSMFLSVGAAEVNGVRQGEYFAGLNFYLGKSISANAAVNRRGATTETLFEVQRPIPVGTGFGYRLQSRRTNGGEQAGSSSVTYQAPFGRYEIAADPYHLGDKPLLTAAGGAVYAAGALKLARPVQESFALVRVPGVKNVRVYQSNQVVGRTDAEGNLLVPALLSYYGNVLRIEDKDVPLDYDVRAVEKVVAPPYRGGAVIEFPVARVQTITGTLVVRINGQQTVPAFGELTLTGNGATFASPLGRAGEFYFENVPSGAYAAAAQFTDGACSFTLEVPKSTESVVKLGTVSCTSEAGKP